jgi:hypothetical protein
MTMVSKGAWEGNVLVYLRTSGAKANQIGRISDLTKPETAGQRLCAMAVRPPETPAFHTL